MVQTPDGHGQLELTKFHAPSGRGGDRHAPANTPGIRHVAFAVDDIDANGRGGFRTCDLSRVKRGRDAGIVACLQGESRI